MECNKDEAIRAKGIAEKKLENNDFEGAQKMAKRAQSIYPELENIMQLITICDVHCSSQKRILVSDKDWYAILQVDRLADQLTIKKQYRRLALFLHPDKNRFPGAESAFKLISEANAVLSDPVKKSLYDIKIKVSARSTPANSPTVNIHKRKSQVINKPRSQDSVYSNANRRQAAQSSSSTRPDAFWTACPFCRIKYQYQRQFVNMLLRCQKCSVHFTAYEESAEGVSSKSKQGQHGPQPMTSKPSFTQPAASIVREDQADFKMNTQNEKGNPSSFTDTRDAADMKKGGSDAANVAAGIGCDNTTATETHSGPVLSPRRSSRKRQHVTSTHQASHERKLREDNIEEQNDALDSENSRHCNKNSFPTDVYPSEVKGKQMETVHSVGKSCHKDANNAYDVKARGKKRCFAKNWC